MSNQLMAGKRGLITQQGEALQITADGEDILAYYAASIAHHMGRDAQ